MTTPQQYMIAARYMKCGSMGSFAEYIGRAYLASDAKNGDTLAAAFDALFVRAYELSQIGA